jgi:hypothetical protein
MQSSANYQLFVRAVPHRALAGTTFAVPHLQTQTMVRKLQAWASRIGRHNLPANSSADFVRQHLCLIGLDGLANSLTTNKKSGQLLVPKTQLPTNIDINGLHVGST